MNTDDINEVMMREKRKEDIYYSDGLWTKYDKYIIMDGQDGLPIILPDIKSKSIKYNPFDYYPMILIDFLDLVREISIIHDDHLIIDHSLIEDNDKKKFRMSARKIHGFNEKYGLLGILRSEVSSFQPVVNTTELTFTLKSGIKTDFYDYLSQFIVSLENIEIPYKTKNYFGRYDGRKPRDKYFDSIEHYIGDPIYKLHYNLLDYSQNTLLNWKIFINSNSMPEDNFSVNPAFGSPYNNTWSDILSRHTKISEVGLSIRFVKGEPKLNWDFSSLLDALKIMFIYDKTIGGNKATHCHFCGKPFIKKKADHKCCSNSCNNALRQRRHREKKKSIDEIQKNDNPSKKRRS